MSSCFQPFIKKNIQYTGYGLGYSVIPNLIAEEIMQGTRTMGKDSHMMKYVIDYF